MYLNFGKIYDLNFKFNVAYYPIVGSNSILRHALRTFLKKIVKILINHKENNFIRDKIAEILKKIVKYSINYLQINIINDKLDRKNISTY